MAILNANIPDDLLYTEQGLWVRIEGDTATVGIMEEFSTRSTADEIYPPDVNSRHMTVGFYGTEVFAMPYETQLKVSGIVTAVNIALKKDPELTRKSRYSDGWVFKAKLSDVEAAKSSLLTKQQYWEHYGYDPIRKTLKDLVVDVWDYFSSFVKRA